MKTQDIIIFEPANSAELDALIAFGKALKLNFKISESAGNNSDQEIEISEHHKTIIAKRLENYRRNSENAKNFDDLLKSKRQKYGL